MIRLEKGHEKAAEILSDAFAAPRELHAEEGQRAYSLCGEKDEGAVFLRETKKPGVFRLLMGMRGEEQEKGQGTALLAEAISWLWRNTDAVAVTSAVRRDDARAIAIARSVAGAGWERKGSWWHVTLWRPMHDV